MARLETRISTLRSFCSPLGGVFTGSSASIEIRAAVRRGAARRPLVVTSDGADRLTETAAQRLVEMRPAGVPCTGAVAVKQRLLVSGDCESGGLSGSEHQPWRSRQQLRSVPPASRVQHDHVVDARREQDHQDAELDGLSRRASWLIPNATGGTFTKPRASAAARNRRSAKDSRKCRERHLQMGVVSVHVLPQRAVDDLRGTHSRAAFGTSTPAVRAFCTQGWVMSMSSPSTTTASDLDVLRTRLAEGLAGHLPQHLQRLSWDADRIADHQRQRLRSLLAHAVERSPFHARRLQGIDADRFEVADLEQVPVMTKAEMMASFDQVVTDRRLGLRVVEEHLARSAVEPSLLLDAYVCLVSGGCSGLRGVFVQTVGEYAEFVASANRPAMARMIAGGGPPPEGMLIAFVTASSPVHSTGLRRCRRRAAGPGRVHARDPPARRTRRASQRHPATRADGLRHETGGTRPRTAGRPATDRARGRHRHGRAAERRRPRVHPRRVRRPRDRSVRRHRGSRRPHRARRIGPQLRQRHVHRRTRRRRQPTRPAGRGIGQSRW